MEEERFGFSRMKPIMLITCIPVLYLWITRESNHFVWLFNPLFWIGVVYLWKYIRITFFIIIRKPAVILTNDSITITDEDYSIKWTDVMDVYMAHGGRGRPEESTSASPATYYIIITVREPEKYLRAIRNPFTRWYRWVTRNWRETGAFEVDLSLVRGDEDEIFHRVLRYYQNNRGF
jgi:hypothetical protein